VDSGSTDGTPERLERAGARVLRIAPETFDHGGTRDLAISEARGELVVLLVQDATPGDERWLANLVAEFDDPEVAGAWCRQVARPDAPSVTALRLAESLHGSRKRRLARLPPGRKLADLDPFDRLALCSFDNVCSAVRKSVWRSIRFGPREVACRRSSRPPRLRNGPPARAPPRPILPRAVRPGTRR